MPVVSFLYVYRRNLRTDTFVSVDYAGAEVLRSVHTLPYEILEYIDTPCGARMYRIEGIQSSTDYKGTEEVCSSLSRSCFLSFLNGVAETAVVLHVPSESAKARVVKERLRHIPFKRNERLTFALCINTVHLQATLTTSFLDCHFTDPIGRQTALACIAPQIV